MHFQSFMNNSSGKPPNQQNIESVIMIIPSFTAHGSPKFSGHCCNSRQQEKKSVVAVTQGNKEDLRLVAKSQGDKKKFRVVAVVQGKKEV